MKKLMMLICAAIIGITAASAQNEWMEGPGKYVAANTRTVDNRTSACNQGGEAFVDFIAKFRTSAQFRKSRVRFASSDEYAKQCFQYFDNWQILKAQQKKETDEEWYSTWYGITASQVCLEFSEWPTDPESEWGGSSLYARFQRIAGKWYMTGFMVAG